MGARHVLPRKRANLDKSKTTSRIAAFGRPDRIASQVCYLGLASVVTLACSSQKAVQSPDAPPSGVQNALQQPTCRHRLGIGPDHAPAPTVQHHGAEICLISVIRWLSWSILAEREIEI